MAGTLPAIKVLVQQLSDVQRTEGGQFKLPGLPVFERVWVQVRAAAVWSGDRRDAGRPRQRGTGGTPLRRRRRRAPAAAAAHPATADRMPSLPTPRFRAPSSRSLRARCAWTTAPVRWTACAA